VKIAKKVFNDKLYFAALRCVELMVVWRSKSQSIGNADVGLRPSGADLTGATGAAAPVRPFVTGAMHPLRYVCFLHLKHVQKMSFLFRSPYLHRLLPR